MAGRLLLAAGLLVPVLIASTGLREALRGLRRLWLIGLVSGIVNAALPFTLIAWGQTHIDSGTAAIANASMPIFSCFSPCASGRARARGARGSPVSCLASSASACSPARTLPEGGGESRGRGVVAAAFCYAAGALYAQHHIEAVPVLVFSTAQSVAGALVLLPFGIAQLPSEAPGWKAIASVLALGIAGTAVGTLLYYRLVNLHGSARASLVVYLLPPFALLYGTTLLDEPLSPQKLIGLLLILGGVTLGSGLVTWARAAGAGARMKFRIRRATEDDVDFLLELANHEDVEPFMSVRRARDRETLLAEIERSEREPLQSGRFVIEVGGGGPVEARRRAGIRRREPAQQDRQSRRSGDASGFSGPPDRRRSGTAAATTPALRPGLPPTAARVLRLQRACHSSRGAFRFRAGGREKKGISPSRRVGGRDHVRPSERRS